MSQPIASPSAGQATGSRRRRWASWPLRGLLVVALACTASLAGVVPAQANVVDDVTVTPTRSVPDKTITVRATFTATTLGSTEVGVRLPAGLAGVATWTSAAVTPVRPGQPCVLDTPPSEAACKWDPAKVGETATLTATLSLPATTVPGEYPITAFSPSALPMATNLNVITNATRTVSLSEPTLSPGSSVRATGTFTALTGGDIRVSIVLLGTAGNGTLGTPVSATGLDNCQLDSSARTVSCTWVGAAVGDTRSLVVPVTARAATPVGMSFAVQACVGIGVDRVGCDITRLPIVDGPHVAYPAGTGQVGVALRLVPQTSGLTEPVRYAVTKGSLPRGLSLSASTGVISGTPTRAGSTFVQVTATGARGRTADTKVAFAITDRPVTHLDYPAGVGQVGTALVPLAPHTSGLTAPVSYAITAGALPAGLAMDSFTGVITGTPTTAGTATATVTATGSRGGTASADVTITIADASGAPHLDYPAGVGVVGVGLHPLAPHTAGLTGALTYAATGGALPAGLALDPTTGVISGTPTAAGASTVTVRVTGTEGSATAQVAITVNPADRRTQRPARASYRPPAELAVPGTTVITPRGAVTNAGRDIRTRVTCTPLLRSRAAVPAGDAPALCRVDRGPGTRVTVTTTTRDVRVTVVQSAPGTAAYRPYRTRIVYLRGQRT